MAAILGRVSDWVALSPPSPLPPPSWGEWVTGPGKVCKSVCLETQTKVTLLAGSVSWAGTSGFLEESYLHVGQCYVQAMFRFSRCVSLISLVIFTTFLFFVILAAQ